MTESPIQPRGPRGEVAPATVLFGDLFIRSLEWAEHVDFLLSVRDEKLATMLQFYRDFGWWVIGLGALLWLVYEYKRQKKDETTRGSIGSLVASVAFVSFLLGSVITVRATGTLPNIIMGYGGNTNDQTCTADIDVSRLSGFAEDYRLILLCGMMNPSREALDDTRIAVSSPFHINAGGGTAIRGIVVPIGNLKEILKSTDMSKIPPMSPGQTPAVQFQMWHAIALIPKDVQTESIKKASDVTQLGGRILTEPVGSWGSGMAIPLPLPAQDGSVKPKKT
jgi:hypothetical protein